VATFCLVHGAWHDDACWELLVAELERRGHECTTPVLPLEDAGASFEDNAAVVIECLDGREAPVLVGHSMSSAVIPLVAIRRAVRLTVYLCPAMADSLPRRTSRRINAPATNARRWTLAIEAGGHTTGPSGSSTAASTRGSLSASRRGCVPSRRHCSARRIRSSARPEVPSAFLFAREDELFDDEWSRCIARQQLGVEAIELPGGHFPMLEHPAALAVRRGNRHPDDWT
jgi:pimeloyl-ACP methyl ester carboxylesterase